MLNSRHGHIRFRRAAAWRFAAASVPTAFLIFLLAIPLYWIGRVSFGYPEVSLDAYEQLVNSSAHLRVLGQTLTMAGIATVAALLLGYPVAYVIAQLRHPWRQIALCVVLLPLWTSLLVRTYAWLIILAPNGPVSRLLMWFESDSSPIDLVYQRTGVLIGLTHSVLPYLILPIYAAILKLDPKLAQAASTLGAAPTRTFFQVTLPLTLPGVIAGVLFAFLLGLGAFVIPALLGGPSDRTIAIMIESAANQSLNWNYAAALALELLAVTLFILYCQHRLFGLGAMFGAGPSLESVGFRLRPFARVWNAVANTLPSVPAGWLLRRRVSESNRGRAPVLDVVLRVIAGIGFVYLALPLFVVVPVSFSSSQYLQFPPPGLSLQWYVRFLSDERWIDATALSVVVGLAVVVLALIVGTLAAVAVAKGTSRWRSILAVACIAPMVIPNMVLALGVFFTFSQLHLVGTVSGIVLAHSMLALPFVFIAVTAALQEIDPSLERAADVLGARPFHAFRRVVLPLLKPFLITAALFAFIISFDEIVIALFLTSVSARTLPKMIWENITMFIDPTVSAVSVILILLSSVFVLGGQLLQARRARIAKEQA